jgi:hypothetical protein
VYDKQLQQFSAGFLFSHINALDQTLKGMSFERATLSLHLDSKTVQLNSTLRSNAETFTANLDATIQNFLNEPEIDFAFYARGSAGNKGWEFAGLPQPNSASLALNMKGKGQTGPFQHIRTNWQEWLKKSSFAGTGTFAIQNINYADKFSDLEGQASISAEYTNGAGKVTFSDNNFVTASGIDPGWLDSLGIPAEFAQQVSRGISLRMNDQANQVAFRSHEDGTDLNIAGAIMVSTANAKANVKTNAEGILDRQYNVQAFKLNGLTAKATGLRYAGTLIDRVTLSGDLHGFPQSWRGNLDLLSDINQLQFDPLAGKMAHAALPLQIKFDKGNWQIILRQPGHVSLEKLAPIKTASITGPLTATIPRANFKLTSQAKGFALTHDLQITSTNFSMQIDQDEKPAVDAQISGAEIKLTGKFETNAKYQGQSDINLTSVALPQSQLQFDNITSQLNLDPDAQGIIATFKLGNVKHNAASPYFTPHSLSGKVFRQNDIYSFESSAGIPRAQYAMLSGALALDSGLGNVKISIPSLRFVPGGLQPEALLPELAAMKDVNATISNNIQFSWSTSGMTNSNGYLLLKDATCKYQDITVFGLNAALTLNDLFSPTSPPGQTITVRNIDLGVPIKNLSIAYQIQATDPLKIAIEQARASLIGGTMSIAPAIIDPTSSHVDTIIQVADLDLGILFGLIKVQGLSGTGRMDGSIPITIDGKHIAINKGQLSADAPGIIRFKSERVSQLLSGAGKEMALLLEALAEFHYSELTIKMDKSIKNDLVATLSLLGNNPHVKGGQLFRLNINLESNIDQILNSIAQGYIISNVALRNIFRLR